MESLQSIENTVTRLFSYAMHNLNLRFFAYSITGAASLALYSSCAPIIENDLKPDKVQVEVTGGKPFEITLPYILEQTRLDDADARKVSLTLDPANGFEIPDLMVQNFDGYNNEVAHPLDALLVPYIANSGTVTITGTPPLNANGPYWFKMQFGCDCYVNDISVPTGQSIVYQLNATPGTGGGAPEPVSCKPELATYTNELGDEYAFNLTTTADKFDQAGSYSSGENPFRLVIDANIKDPILTATYNGNALTAPDFRVLDPAAVAPDQALAENGFFYNAAGKKQAEMALDGTNLSGSVSVTMTAILDDQPVYKTVTFENE